MDALSAYQLGLDIYFSVIVFIFGICIGSFLNVLVYRIPLGLDFKHGSSFCPTCKHELKWYDLFPLFSWIFLGGKCRYCKTKISPIYPIGESVTGIMFTLSFIFLCGCDFKRILSLIGYCMVCAALFVLFCIDWKHMFIPDSMWILIFIGGVLVYVDSIIQNGFDKHVLINKIIATFLVSGLFFAVEYLKPDSIGGGDIKLMAAAGFVLGIGPVIFSVMVASVVGVIYLIVSNSFKKENFKKQVPFGPHLAVGIFVSMLFGTRIIEWFVNIWA